MADHWEYVLAAYGLAAIVFGGYWRRLCRRERELNALTATRRNTNSTTSRGDITMRSRQSSMTGQPRPEAGERAPRP
jgi:hypothetical protein